MADERDPQISQRYRELGTQEPPPALDRAILAAARRATSRHRWYSSLAAAAVLIFAVAIVVQFERQPPDQVPMSTPSTPVAAPPSEQQAAPQEREAPTRSPAKPAQRRRAAPDVQFAPEPPARTESAPSAPAPAPTPDANVAAPAAGAAADVERKRADEMQAAPQLQRSRVMPRAAHLEEEPPERWLERIIELRRAGRHEEADKQLAAFRQHHPSYKVPEAALRREK